MAETRRKFTREFKVAAVKRLQAGFPVGRVARELEVNPNQLHAWRREFENLARLCTLTAVNQLWVADITYIQLEDEFVYLAVILDAHSRLVIGWVLERTLESSLSSARYKWRWRDAGRRPA